MGTPNIPEEPEGLTETVEEEFIETVHERVIKHPRRTVADIEGKREEPYRLPPTSTVRVISEEHHAGLGHIYTIELTDLRYFSEPIFIKFVLDSNGMLIEPDTEK